MYNENEMTEAIQIRESIVDSTYVSPESQWKIDELRSAGVRILKDGTSVERALQIVEGRDAVVHTHRRISGKDVFFIANITTQPNK